MADPSRNPDVLRPPAVSVWIIRDYIFGGLVLLNVYARLLGSSFIGSFKSYVVSAVRRFSLKLAPPVKAGAECKSNLKYLIRCISAATILATAALAQSVNVSSPSNGTTVASPVHISASVNGGNYPVSAIWVYVDDQPAFKTADVSVNTYLSLAAGSHHVVTNAWNSIGQVASSSQYISVTSNAGVAIASPSSGATVGSPVQFVASAAAPSGRVIDAMRIYVDSSNAYTVGAASINTAVAMAPGIHSISMQAWDNTGAVYVEK